MNSLYDALNKRISRLPGAAAFHLEVVPALLDSLAQLLATMPELDHIVEDSRRKARLLKHEVEDLLPSLYNGAAAALLADLIAIIVQISVKGTDPESPGGITGLADEQSSPGAKEIAVQLADLPGLASFLQNALQALRLSELDIPLILRRAATTLPEYVNAVLGICAGASPYRNGLERYFFAKRIHCHQTVDDLVDNTLLRAYLAIRGGRPPITPAAWLRTLARNVLATYLAERVRHSFLEMTDDIEIETAVPHDFLSRIILRELIKTVKHEVDKKAALVCRLKLRGHTDEEVATMIKCSKKNVARKLGNVLKFVKRKWGIAPSPEYGPRRKRGRAHRPASKASA